MNKAILKIYMPESCEKCPLMFVMHSGAYNPGRIGICARTGNSIYHPESRDI